MNVHIDGEYAGAAILREDVAPRTSAAIWDALPIEGKLMHGTSSGEAVFFAVDVPLSIDLVPNALGSSDLAVGNVVAHGETVVPPENATCYVSQGDFVLTPYKACLIAYGRRAIIRSYVGELPSNAFAFVREPSELDALERLCKATLAHGAKRIVLDRAS